MTLTEAEATVASTHAWVKRKMAQYGFKYEQGHQWHTEIELYDELTGEYTPPSQRYDTAEDKLKFYRDRRPKYRGMSKDIDCFIINRIQEALRGE